MQAAKTSFARRCMIPGLPRPAGDPVAARPRCGTPLAMRLEQPSSLEAMKEELAMSKVLAISFFAVQLVFAGSAFAGSYCTQNGSCAGVTETTDHAAVSATEPVTALAVGLGLAGAAFLRRRK